MSKVLDAVARLDRVAAMACWREDGVGEYVIGAKTVRSAVEEIRGAISVFCDALESRHSALLRELRKAIGSQAKNRRTS